MPLETVIGLEILQALAALEKTEIVVAALDVKLQLIGRAQGFLAV